MLIGILPIYVAVALGILIFAAPVEAQRMVLSIGLVLPFLAGLWGVYSRRPVTFIAGGRRSEIMTSESPDLVDCSALGSAAQQREAARADCLLARLSSGTSPGDRHNDWHS
jgi:hypothetical protein